jgi:hypothetical protein
MYRDKEGSATYPPIQPASYDQPTRKKAAITIIHLIYLWGVEREKEDLQMLARSLNAI